MATITPPTFTKTFKSQEEYKEMWMSLFDVNVVSTCNEKDSDLFCASALLKTAFYNFIRLKRRLNQTQDIVNSQKLELETLKLESEKLISKMYCYKSKDTIPLSEDNVSQLEPNMQNSDTFSGNELKNQTRISGAETHVVSLEFMKVQDDKRLQHKTRPSNPNFLVAKTHLSGGINSTQKNEFLDFKEVYLEEENICCESTKTFHSEINVHNSSEREQERHMLDENKSIVSKECKHLYTPERNLSSADEVQSISPVLKQSKKSRFSSYTISRVKKSGKGPPTKSPSLLSSDFEFIEEVLLKKDNQESMEKIANESGTRNAINIKNKAKISSLSLKPKPPHVPQAKYTFSEQNIPTDEKNPTIIEQTIYTCKSYNSPEKEEVEIIMPSPGTSKAENLAKNPDFVASPRKVCEWNKNEGLKNTQISGAKYSKSCKKRRASMLSDTDATYFVPMEDLEVMENSFEANVLTHPPIEDDRREQEEMDKGKFTSEEEECSTSDKTREPSEAPKTISCSFDRLPSRKDSPPYKYQRNAVRRKDERRKLFGWECRDCQKYYDVAGYGMDSAERKRHLNKCSRHRNKYSPHKNTPKGFWDPLFPDTPK